MAGSRSRQEPDPDFEIMVEDASASTSETASLVDSPSSSTSPPVSVVDDEPTETTETQTSQKRKKNPLVAGRGGLKKQSTRVQKQKGSTTDIKNPAAAVATVAATTDIEEVVFSPSELEGMQGALLSWYDENHRVLPWRRNAHSRRSPAAVAAEPYQAPPGDLSDDVFIYYVWVCEIMSQQTQVSRVCEYFTRWVKKWPTVGDLARASQEELNEAWAGLGYYRRAKYLLDGAKYVVAEMGGTFPRTAEELRKIPGVGPYTSRAIASQACGEPVAVVDGNVVRVLSRLRRIGGDPKSAQMVKLFADVADRTLAGGRPGDFNQAVMELGATVCVPNTAPLCGSCPVRAWCRAARDGVVSDYPSKAVRAAKREERVAVSVLRAVEEGGKQGWQDGRFLLLKRPEEGLLAGLWEFPLVATTAAGAGDAGDAAGAGAGAARSSPSSSSERVMDAYLREEIGLPVARVVSRTSLGEQVAIFSHIRMTMEVEELCVVLDAGNGAKEVKEGTGGAGGTEGTERAVMGGDRMHWLTFDALCERRLSSSVKKCLDAYRSHHVRQDNERAKKANGISKFFVRKAK
jgi:A/G-specific adenine glycosylase